MSDPAMKFKTQIHYSIELSDNYWFRRSEESARQANGVSAYGELHFKTKAQLLDWVRVIHAEYVKHTDGTMDATYINRRPVGAEFDVQYRAAGDTAYELGCGMVYAETPVEYRTISRKKVTKTVEVDGETYTKTIDETVYGEWKSSPDVNQRLCFSIAEWTFHLPEDAEDESPSEVV